jgi:hypothetical protein
MGMARQHRVRPDAHVLADVVDLFLHLRTIAVPAGGGVNRMMVAMISAPL